MRRILFVLIFVICTVAYLFPDYPMQARPMLTVPAGTPRPRPIPTAIFQATPVVNSGQWTVDSEILGNRGGTGGGQGSIDAEKTSDDQELSTVHSQLSVINYPLSTKLSVLPMFVMQGDEVLFSVTVRYEDVQVSDDGDKPPVAKNVVVSQELPDGLDFVRVDQPQKVGYRGGITPEGRRFFQFSWPSLAAGESVTAQATLRVLGNAPSGTALSFLSVTQAEDGGAKTSVVRVGTPPSELPDFELISGGW